MSKKTFQDVIPQNKKGIRQIPVPKRKKKKNEPIKEQGEFIENDHLEPLNGEKPLVPKWIILGGIIIVAVFLFFIFSSIFASAKISIEPKTISSNLNHTFIASKEPSDLQFETLTVELTKEKSVPATGEEEVAHKASGKIVVYNSYSASPQKLIKNTRFESPEGLIYRIDESITVPGKSGDQPGSIEVMVYADSSGEEYNIPKTDFTIPGFKGMPQYTKFSASSVTDMAGGFRGVRKVIDEEDRAGAVDELRAEIESELPLMAREQMIDTHILYDDSYDIEFQSADDVIRGDNVVLKETGMLTAWIFDKESLSRFVANAVLDDYNGEEIIIENIDGLDFNLIDDESVINNGLSQISFELRGTANLIWQIDDVLIKSQLTGQPKEKLAEILNAFSGINKAEATVSPFWRKTFPESSDKIKVQINQG